MKREPGVSLVEILIAIVVLGVLVLPISGVLTSSNRASTASLYEIMAVQYALELSQQLQRLTPELIKQLRSTTKMNLEELLEEESFRYALNDRDRRDESSVELKGTRFPVFLSPLHPDFASRTVTVSALPALDPKVFSSRGTFWQVKVNLSWKADPSDKVDHSLSFPMILREAP